MAALQTWVTAAKQATLYFNFKGDYESGMTDFQKMAGPDIVTALTASLAVGACKVIFKWTPKVMLPQMGNGMNNNSNQFGPRKPNFF